MAKLPSLNWQTVDVDTMPKTIAPMYNKYRETLAKAAEERKKLEDTITAHLSSKKKIPDGLEPRYGYRWGKLAIAFAEPGEAKGAGGDQFTF